jgi:hypothetical protein
MDGGSGSCEGEGRERGGQGGLSFIDPMRKRTWLESAGEALINLMGLSGYCLIWETSHVGPPD